MSNEKKIQGPGKYTYDPDLTKHHMKTRKTHVDFLTGETIPVGSETYSIGIRRGRKLYREYLTPASYAALENEQEEEQ